ncbi:hypothetical protein C8R44DRAFT_879467 [Mycena epipterygia]|nr:hypothetical protein C8R44DRAFT_879467 [Mycena epipterygia]
MSDLPTAPDVTLLFGPMLIGVLLNTLAYGVMLVQAYSYYHRYKSDRLWFRYLSPQKTANWVCDVGLIYEPLIIRYATPEALTVTPLLLRADGLLTVLVSTPVQLFIAWRVRVVTNSFVLPSIIALLATISLCTAILYIFVLAPLTSRTFSNSVPRFNGEIITWLIASAACDVFLTGSLVHSLWVRKTNIISTDSYINKVIRLTVQTGFIATAAAILDLTLFIASPHTTLNFMIDFPLSKLYTISLISTLNARAWREEVSKHEANVLFEKTPTGQTSFNLVERPSVFVEHPSVYFVRTPGPLFHVADSDAWGDPLASPTFQVCYGYHVPIIEDGRNLSSLYPQHPL